MTKKKPHPITGDFYLRGPVRLLFFLLDFLHFENEIFFEIVVGSEIAFGCFEIDSDRDSADAGLLLDEEAISVFGNGCRQFVRDACGECLSDERVYFVAEDGFVECSVILCADAAGFLTAVFDVGGAEWRVDARVGVIVAGAPVAVGGSVRVSIEDGCLGASAGCEVDRVFESAFDIGVAFEGAHIGIDNHERVAAPIFGDGSVPMNALDERLQCSVMEEEHDVFVAELFLDEGGDFWNVVDGGEAGHDFCGEFFHDSFSILLGGCRDIVTEVVFFDSFFELECAAIRRVGAGIAGNGNGSGQPKHMVENNGVNGDNGVEFFSSSAQSIEILRLLRIGGEIWGEV